MHLFARLLRTVTIAGLAATALGASASGAQELPPGFTDGVPVGAADGPAPPAGQAAPERDASAAAITQRYFGDGPYFATRVAVAATARDCALSDDGLTALVLAPVFKES